MTTEPQQCGFKYVYVNTNRTKQTQMQTMRHVQNIEYDNNLARLKHSLHSSVPLLEPLLF